MAISVSSAPRTLLFLVFVLLTIATSSPGHANPSFSIKASKDLIFQICSRTINGDLCFQVLNADPRTPAASLKDVGLISVGLAESQVKTTQTLIASLLKKATDPKLQGQLKSCQGNYGQATSALNQGRNDLNSGNYRRLGSDASAAVAAAETCQSGFVWFKIPEPPELKEANEKSRDLNDIPVAISALLLLLPPSP